MFQLASKSLLAVFLSAPLFLHGQSSSREITSTKAGLLRVIDKKVVTVDGKQIFISNLPCYIYFSFRPDGNFDSEYFLLRQNLADCSYFRVIEITKDNKIHLTEQIGNGTEYPEISIQGHSWSVLFGEWKPTRGGVIPKVKYVFQHGRMDMSQ